MEVEHIGVPRSNPVADVLLDLALSGISDSKAPAKEYRLIQNYVIGRIRCGYADGEMDAPTRDERLATAKEVLAASRRRAQAMSAGQRRREYQNITLMALLLEGGRILKQELLTEYRRVVAAMNPKPPHAARGRSARQSHCRWSAHRARAACGGDSSGGDDSGSAADGPQSVYLHQEPAWLLVTRHLIAAEIHRRRHIVNRLGDSPAAWELAGAATDLEREAFRTGVLR